MRVIWSPVQSEHDGGQFIEHGRFVPSPEIPERSTLILTELERRGYEIGPPDDAGIGPILGVHDPSYVEFLRTAEHVRQTTNSGAMSLTPNVHPRGHVAARPSGLVGLLGWHTGDMACEINAGTWPAAYASAQTAVSATKALLRTGDVVYALCRPPGHHAGRNRAMGFCYLNNAAVAAQILCEEVGRVAILDIDVHHGNGTQEIFYDRGDVFFASIHGDPSHYYPFYWGYPQQMGEGEGLGSTLNVPFPVGSGTDAYLDALRKALTGLRSFAPKALVLSLGTDAFVDDPHGRHTVNLDGFIAAANMIAELGVPTVIVQEGGYPFEGLGRLTADFLDVFKIRDKV